MHWYEMKLSGKGRTSSSVGRVCRPERIADVPKYLEQVGKNGIVVRGSASSYADQTLNTDGAVMMSGRLDCIRSFNEETGEFESVSFNDLTEEQQLEIKSNYEKVMDPLRESTGRANGYLILTILAVGTSFLAQFLMQHRVGKKNKEKGVQTQPANKVLMIILPLIMGIFTLFYNSIFALYIIVGQIISIITAPIIDLIIDKVEERAEKKKEAKVVVDYSRKK